MTSSIVWLLLSQLANPVSLSDKTTRNEDLILPITDDKDFDGGGGKDISLSEVLGGLLTKQGALMQIVINAVLVRTDSWEKWEVIKVILFQSTAFLTFWMVMDILP